MKRALLLLATFLMCLQSAGTADVGQFDCKNVPGHESCPYLGAQCTGNRYLRQCTSKIKCYVYGVEGELLPNGSATCGPTGEACEDDI